MFNICSGERAWRDCLEEECVQLAEQCHEHSRILGAQYVTSQDGMMALLARRDMLGRRGHELQEEIVSKKDEVS